LKTTLVLGCAALVGFPLGAGGQSFTARFGDVPPLKSGQRVRVWTWESTPFVPTPWPPARTLRMAGTLIAYQPPESLTLRRSGFLSRPSPERERTRTAYWVTVRRIDVPAGRNVLGGAVQGIIGAVGLGLLASGTEWAFCVKHEPCGTPVPKNILRAAAITVPVGLVAGYFSTRWRRVYVSQR
jgi:hypothetical protein